MTLLLALIAQLLHAALILAVAPLLTGLCCALRARLRGHAGPPVLQPWRDLLRLSRKLPVLPDNASWLFAAAPAAACAAVLTAGLLVPSFTTGMLTAPAADLLVIAGLLALARAVLALAAMDPGTAAGGRDASRAVTTATLAEPAVLLAIFVPALLLGGTNLDAIAGALRDGGLVLRAPLALVLAALVGAGLADAETVPRGEYSGRHLALLDFAASLRGLLLLSLIAAVFLPFGLSTATASPLSWLLGLLAWLAKLGLLLLAGTLLETAAVSLRPRSMPVVLGTAALLGLLAALLLFAGQSGAA